MEQGASDRERREGERIYDRRQHRPRLRQIKYQRHCESKDGRESQWEETSARERGVKRVTYPDEPDRRKTKLHATPTRSDASITISAHSTQHLEKRG